MLRYLALVWDVEQPRAAETAQRLLLTLRRTLPELATAFRAPGVAVHCAPSRAGRCGAYPVEEESGVVLGSLFPFGLDPQEVAPRVSLLGAAGAGVTHSAGRELISRYWGQYVAFLRDPNGRDVRVLRDPTGGVPCYEATYADVTVFFSHLRDCESLGIDHFSINWSFVTARLLAPFSPVEDTGLREVRDVLPGQCRTLSPGRGTQAAFYWDPLAFATNPLEDLEEAITLARRTVLACVGAWASDFPEILVQLSGGLDSSILLACLRMAPSRPALRCVNHFTRTPWGDERRFARLAVQAAGPRPVTACELIEYEKRPEDVRLSAIMQTPVGVNPTSYLMAHFVRAHDLPIAQRHGVPVFNGTYGDNVFFTKTRFSAGDYAHSHGLGWGLLSIAPATAFVLGVPIWRLMQWLVRERLRRMRGGPLAGAVPTELQREFVDPDVIQAYRAHTAPSPVPWLRANDLPAGKNLHLKAVSLPPHILNPLHQPTDPPWIAAFYSQPLIELFLRIPSYLLAADGQQRAIARRAFAGELPQEIRARVSKGSGNDFLLRLLQNNFAAYRELMLEGVMVRAGLLNRKKVEQFFATAIDPAASGIVELLIAHFNLELYLRARLEASGSVVAGGLARASGR